MKDAYDILGVDRKAPPAAIKQAYRKLAREKHPDSNPDDPKAEDGFKELKAAYEVLSNPDQRARYDSGLIDAAGNPLKRQTTGYDARGRAQSKPQKKSGPRKDPFAKFRKKKREQQTVKIDGANVDYNLSLKAEEAAKGGVKYISMTNGKRLKVTIPSGTRDGQVLRLKNQGMPGMGGGANGDALVTIGVDKDSRFRIDGRDVHLDLPISLALAVLGGKIKAPTLTGEVSLTIPENSSSGTKLRLKGKGLAAEGGKAAGDQYVHLMITLPKSPDPELREFVQDWAKSETAKS